jgi:guanylate kinase
LLEHHPAARLSVSCTTRAPRPGEREGVEYFFLSTEDFQSRRDHGELLEWAEVYPGVMYGTPRAPVEAALDAGEDVILEIDDEGAHLVRSALGERATLVFIAPPSFTELERRLRDRATESASSLRERLATAGEEISHLGDYDYCIVNDDLPAAAATLRAVLEAEQAACSHLHWEELRARLLREARESEIHHDP